MKYYIVYYDYGPKKEYYSGYKNKIESEYSDNYLFAKKYKSLSGALNRTYTPYKKHDAVKLVEKLEKNRTIFDNGGIEVISIPNTRKRKLDIINGMSDSPIKNLGDISNNELFDFLKKEADKFLRSGDGRYYHINETKTATEEDIEDFLNDW